MYRATGIQSAELAWSIAMLPAGDVAILRRALAMTVADRRQIAVWAAIARGTAIVARWQAAGQRARAEAARARAEALRQDCARLRAVSGGALRLHDGDHLPERQSVRLIATQPSERSRLRG